MQSLGKENNNVSGRGEEIIVHLGEELQSSDGLSSLCCPLGAQFYLKKMLEPDKMLSLMLELPHGGGTKEVIGIVVYSDLVPQKNVYRTLVYFLDRVDFLTGQAPCQANEDSSCPFCEKQEKGGVMTKPSVCCIGTSGAQGTASSKSKKKPPRRKPSSRSTRNSAS